MSSHKLIFPFASAWRRHFFWCQHKNLNDKISFSLCTNRLSPMQKLVRSKGNLMKRRVQSWPGARQENRCSLCLVFRIGHIVFSMERERRRRQLPTTKLRTWVLVCLVGSLVSSPPNAGLIAMAFLFFFHFQRYQMVKEISLGKKKEKEKQPKNENLKSLNSFPSWLVSILLGAHLP